MTVLDEAQHAGGFLVSEANGTRSREVVTILADQVLPPGAVLGKVTASDKYVAYDNGAADGSQTAVAILYAPVDATGADAQATVVVGDAEVNAAELDWGANDQAGIDAGLADLLSLGIVPR